jgi:hypothetical protein
MCRYGDVYTKVNSNGPFMTGNPGSRISNRGLSPEAEGFMSRCVAPLLAVLSVVATHSTSPTLASKGSRSAHKELFNPMPQEDHSDETFGTSF